jgi:hypothetical protein
MCNSGEVGRQWVQDITVGKRTILDAAMFFKCSNEDIITHMNFHDTEIIDDSGDLESPDFLINEMLKLFKMLRDWLKYSIQSGDMSRQDYELALKMIKETREVLKTLGDWQGKSSGNKEVTINIEMINNQYKQITNMLVTEVCPECRLKVINMLDKMETPILIS